MLFNIHIGCNDVFSPQCVSKCDFSEKQVDWLSSCTVCIFEAFSQSGFFCGHSESSWVHEKVHESKICSEQVSQLWTFQRGQQPLCVPSSSRMVFVIKKPVAVHSRFRSITFFHGIDLVGPSTSCEAPLRFVSYLALVAPEWSLHHVSSHVGFQITRLGGCKVAFGHIWTVFLLCALASYELSYQFSWYTNIRILCISLAFH